MEYGFVSACPPPYRWFILTASHCAASILCGTLRYSVAHDQFGTEGQSKQHEFVISHCLLNDIVMLIHVSLGVSYV